MTAPAARLPDRHTQPGDLQALVAQYGGYHLITPAAWAAHDAAIAQWRTGRLAAMGLRPISPAEMKKRRRAAREAKKHAAVGLGDGQKAPVCAFWFSIKEFP